MTVSLDQEWADRVSAASAGLAGERSGTVAIELGKKEKAVLSIVDGRVVSATVGEDASAMVDGADGAGVEVGVTVPTSGEQLASFMDGSSSLARAYMMGDVKPVGATGPLLALVELFESDEFRSGL